jgi:hypothetical protein
MSPHEPSEPTAGIPLEASVDELRRRCEAVARLQGGSTYYHEELGIFRDFAEEKGFFLADPPPELNRTPDEEGIEHQVWFDRNSATYLKATWRTILRLTAVSELSPLRSHFQTPSSKPSQSTIFE